MARHNTSITDKHDRFKLSTLILTSALTLTFGGLSNAASLYETWIQKYEPDLGSSPSVSDVAIDKNGDVAITGWTYSNGTEVYYTAKYRSSDGSLAWERTYNSGGGASRGLGVAFDNAGNVVVTGKSVGTVSGNDDFFTAKYRGSDGVPLWSGGGRRYDGTNSGGDEGNFIAVDAANNVVVTGRSVGAGSFVDIYTVKYDANGTFVGEVRYTTAGTREDYPTGLAIDSAGKVIVAGVARVDSDDKQFYLVKYDLDATPTTDWEKAPFGVADDDDEPTGLAIGREDEVIVTGYRAVASSSANTFWTLKYLSDGTYQWDTIDGGPVSDPFSRPAGVATDSVGNVFVTGTRVVDNFNKVIYTVKYDTETGDILWTQSTSAPGEPGVNGADDEAAAIAVDAFDRVVVSGAFQTVTEDSDFVVFRYSNDGALLGGRLFNEQITNSTGGEDIVKAMAVDDFGNIAITGDSLRPAGTLNQIVTIKYGSTALATDDLIAGKGIPENARISALNSPAIADSGKIAARVTVAAGKKKLGAIVTVGGGTPFSVPAVQGGDAPEVTGAAFRSFSDPVIAPNGSIGFIAKMSGVKASESTGVWTTSLSLAGALQNILQQGKQVFGLPDGILLQSVSGISVRNGQLVALIKVSGKDAGVTKGNSTIVYARTILGGGDQLVRTGDPLTVDGVESTIKSLSFFTPPKGSAGHGRYFGDGKIVVRATLADRRSVLLAVTTGGTATQVLFSGKDAGSIESGATWNSFGLPAIDSGGDLIATAGSLARGDSVTPANDTAIAYTANNGTSFVNVAQEGDDAPGITGADFATFQDPLVKTGGEVAFIGTAKGSGVNGKNKTGLWFGPAGNVTLFARTNHEDFPATDGSGADTEARWSSFTSLALPGGANAGPIFLAKLSGKGVNGKNNVGLWAVDSAGLVRRLIRTGDGFGNLTVKKFTVLQPSSGSVGVSRSFSSGGSVSVLVDFSDKSKGVVNLAIP